VQLRVAIGGRLFYRTAKDTIRQYNGNRARSTVLTCRLLEYFMARAPRAKPPAPKGKPEPRCRRAHLYLTEGEKERKRKRALRLIEQWEREKPATEEQHAATERLFQEVFGSSSTQERCPRSS
jgi:hypothetical protein